MELRGEDIPFWLERLSRQGTSAIGLTGQDLYTEYLLSSKARARSTQTLRVLASISWQASQTRFGKPALCLIGPSDATLPGLASARRPLRVSVPAKYRALGRRYLNTLELQGYTFLKQYLRGGIEATIKAGLADLAIDIVYTGDTLREMGLAVYNIILLSDFYVLETSMTDTGGDTYE